MSWNKEVPFETLIGQKILSVTGLEKGSGEVRFTVTDGQVIRMYRMYHWQDCCESVTIEDIWGDPSDLIGQEVVVVGASSSIHGPAAEWSDSQTWTFYKLATRKGWLDIRWYGESNGYYSEEVTFEEVS